MVPELVLERTDTCVVCGSSLEESGRSVPPAAWCAWCGSDAE